MLPQSLTELPLAPSIMPVSSAPEPVQEPWVLPRSPSGMPASRVLTPEQPADPSFGWPEGMATIGLIPIERAYSPGRPRHRRRKPAQPEPVAAVPECQLFVRK
jgi:hypothetical protein